MLTNREALDHCRQIVNKFAKPLLHLEEVIEAAVAIDEEMATMDKRYAEQETRRLAAVEEADRVEAEARARIDAAESEADAEIAKLTQQLESLRESVATAHIDADRALHACRERVAQAEREEIAAIERLRRDIKDLANEKSELEQQIEAIKRRFV